MMTKHFLMALLVNFGLMWVISATGAPPPPPPDSSTSLSPQITVPKKKVIFIDYGHTVQKNFGSGCGDGYVAIGISTMPKNRANFYKSAPINHEQYKFNFRKIEKPKCVIWGYYWSEYKSFNPSWITGFATPNLTCAPIDVAWQA